MPPKMIFPKGMNPKGKKKSHKAADRVVAPVAEEEAQTEASEEESIVPPVAEEEAQTEASEEESEEEERTETEEEEEEHDTSDANLGSGDEAEVMRPLSMYFQPTEYKKKIRISTRCYVKEFTKTLENLEPPLTGAERNWFASHPQFKHIFHLPKDNSHKLQGMWMLLLRTARIEKKKEAWFVVNGVPIRYGLREHALISGLNCRNYEVNYELGDMQYVRRQFGRKKVRYEDVKKKLEDGMPADRDRLRMLVLYFLCSIIIAQEKCGKHATPIPDFFLKVVDDLQLCKSYPFGRLSFDYMLKEMYHMLDKFNGVVEEDILRPIPGFCIPLELLAFEAIPALASSFREPILEADGGCPLMCKFKFKKSGMRGFPLSSINEKLGTTKDIHNIILNRENVDLAQIFEEDYVEDCDDPVVREWITRYNQGNTIFFPEMYNDDVAARVEEEKEADKEEVEKEEGGTSGEANALNDLAQLVEGMKAEMDLGFKSVNEKLDGFDERMKKVESYVLKKLDEVNEQRPEDPGDRQEEAREKATEAQPPTTAAAHRTEEANEEANEETMTLSSYRDSITRGKRPRGKEANYPSRPCTRSRKTLEEPSQPLEVQLLDKVEVFYENNWRKGFVRGMLQGGRVRVHIYDLKEEHDFGVSEIRFDKQA